MSASQPLPISVCVIAGNEAPRIRRAFDSVAGWVAEIVVVTDDKVNDGTDKIAEACGAKVFCRPWEGHAVHRNFASEKASQPWLLAIDADEVVSPELRDEIISAFSRRGTEPLPAAFSFPRLSFFCGRWIRHGDWYPDRKVRLWQRGAGRWEGNPHEKLVLEGRITPLRADLFHFSNESIDHLLGKIGPVSALSARSRWAQNRRAGWLDLTVRPCWKFFRAYFLRLGFLDGWQGYFIAWMDAFSAVVRYSKLMEVEQNQNGKIS
jgi:glycosyltransferase involved in cell wall biosynthesis